MTATLTIIMDVYTDVSFLLRYSKILFILKPGVHLIVTIAEKSVSDHSDQWTHHC